MARKHYWAVRPVGVPDNYIRIEHAYFAFEAYRMAFGGPLLRGMTFEAKDLGSRVAVLHSDKQRIALLTSREGWKKWICK